MSNQAQELRRSLGIDVSEPVVPEIQYRTMALEYATRAAIGGAVTQQDNAAFFQRANDVYAFLKNGPKVPADKSVDTDGLPG